MNLIYRNYDSKKQEEVILDDDFQFDIVTLIGFDAIHDEDQIIELHNINVKSLKDLLQEKDEHVLINGYKDDNKYTLHLGE